METGDYVAKHHPKAQVLHISELAEISWGDFDGSSSPAIHSILKLWQEGDFDARPCNGESPNDVERRAMPIFYDLILSRPEQTICFICTSIEFMPSTWSITPHHALVCIVSFVALYATFYPSQYVH